MLSYRFGGVEHYIYAHEFDHALVDQSFNVKTLGMDPCTFDSQHCEALTALAEGDAALLMEKWWKQYASPQDNADLASYQAPSLALMPDAAPPPFVVKDVSFPYVQGKDFVDFIYQRGNWGAVNKVYANLPASTEQILHPEKYLAGEAPLKVTVQPYATALGGGWSLIANDVMGEWMTYLLLGSSADVDAQLEDATAKTAAAGWGGDNYQVYYNAAQSETALGAEWVWDTAQDAQEFQAALRQSLEKRYRGLDISVAGQQCWKLNQETSCVFTGERKTLWLVAPDEGQLLVMQQQYADFR